MEGLCSDDKQLLLGLLVDRWPHMGLKPNQTKQLLLGLVVDRWPANTNMGLHANDLLIDDLIILLYLQTHAWLLRD